MKRHIIKHFLNLGHRGIPINLEDAEDMFQDILLTLVDKLNRGAFHFHNETALYKYLKLAASRHYIKCFRRTCSVNKYSRESSIDLENALALDVIDFEDPSAEAKMEMAFEKEILDQLLTQIDPTLKEDEIEGVIQLCVYNGNRGAYKSLTTRFDKNTMNKLKHVRKQLIKSYDTLGED